MKAPGSPVSFQQRTAQKAPRERSAGARRGPLRAASATASGAPESRRPSLRGEGVSLLPLEALLSEGPGVLRCQVAFRPDGQREDGPGVASQKLPQRVSAATPAGPGRAGWTHHLPAWETPAATCHTADMPPCTRVRHARRASRRPASAAPPACLGTLSRYNVQYTDLERSVAVSRNGPGGSARIPVRKKVRKSLTLMP